MPNQYSPKREPIYVIGPSIAYVPLTRGLFALIDREDAPLVVGNWQARWDAKLRGYYAERSVGDPRAMHRLILKTKAKTIDHIDPSRTLDNRRSNLRHASRAEQCRNQRTRSDNKSGCKGVSFRKDIKKWQAVITVDGCWMRLGYADTYEEARAIRIAGTQKLHGDFARIE